MLQDLKTDRERIAREWKTATDDINESVRSLQSGIDQFRSHNATVRRLTQTVADMDSCATELHKANERSTALSTERSDLQAKLTAIKEQLESRDWRMRKLNDHRSLMDVVVRVSQLEEEISVQQAEFGDKPLEQLEEERRQLQDKMSANNRQVHKLEGSLDELRKKMGEAEKRLKEDRYRNAGEHWRQAKVDQVTLREVIKVSQRPYFVDTLSVVYRCF
jgi:chromosome segregation ATPase